SGRTGARRGERSRPAVVVGRASPGGRPASEALTPHAWIGPRPTHRLTVAEHRRQKTSLEGKKGKTIDLDLEAARPRSATRTGTVARREPVVLSAPAWGYG